MSVHRNKIVLTTTEMMIAAYVGSGRNVQSLKQDWTPAAGVGLVNTWTLNIEGAAGEMAVAKFLNIYWLPIIGDNHADDVGPFQVRTNTSRKHTDLCLRPKDNPERCYISVLSFAPGFLILGWIWGADGKVDKWLRDGSPDRPKCFYVPESALHEMDTLPLDGAR
jgi:hypothetical protein